jgi:hypothetical protein
VSATGCAFRGNLSGRSGLLDGRRKRHASEGADFIVGEAQVPARQHQVCQFTCGPLTEAAMTPQRVPLEVTCRGEVAYLSEDGNVTAAREAI